LVVGDAEHAETTAVFALTRGSGQADWAALSEVFTSGRYAGPRVTEPAPAAATPPAAAGRLFTAAEVAFLGLEPGRRPQPHFGAILDRVITRNGARLTPVSLHILADAGEAVAGTADIGELPMGGYDIQIETRLRRAAPGAEILALALIGGGKLIAEQIIVAEGQGLMRATIPFNVDAALAQTPGGVRLALKGLGHADVDVTELLLR